MRVADYDGFRSTGWIVCLCNFKNKCDAWKSMQLVELSGFLFFNTFHPRVDIYAPIYGTLFLNFPLELNSKFFPFQSISLERSFFG